MPALGRLGSSIARLCTSEVALCLDLYVRQKYVLLATVHVHITRGTGRDGPRERNLDRETCLERVNGHECR